MKKGPLSIQVILKYLAAALVLTVPLYPKFPLIPIFGSNVAVRMEDFLIVIIFIFLAIYLCGNSRKILSLNISKAIFFYLVTGLISLLSAIVITKTVSPTIGMLHWLRRIEYFSPFVLGLLVSTQGKKTFNYLLQVLFLMLLIVFIYGFGQKYLHFPLIVTQNAEYAKGVALYWTEGSHINATFAGHYDLATFLVLVLPVVIAAFFILRQKWEKFTVAICFFGGLWLLVNSASRISLAAYLIAATLTLVLLKKFKAIPVIIVISLVFIVFSTNLQFRYSHLFEVVEQKLMSFTSVINKEVLAFDNQSPLTNRQTSSSTPTPVPIVEDRSTSIRFNVEWPRAIRAFVKNPFYGTGYSSINLATDNDYLRVAGETGILGLLSFFLIFIYLIGYLVKLFPFEKMFQGIELSFVSGLSGGLVGVFVNALFIDIFEASKFAILFWFLIGMLVGLMYEQNKNIDQ